MSLEDELLYQIRLKGLPEPVREVQFAYTACGRRWRFDLAYVDQKAAIEVQGGSFVAGAHQSGQGAENDMVKAAVATLLGWRVFHVNNHMIGDGRALLIVETVLGGWHLTEAAPRLAGWRCSKCDLTGRRRRQKARQKARENECQP